MTAHPFGAGLDPASRGPSGRRSAGPCPAAPSQGGGTRELEARTDRAEHSAVGGNRIAGRCDPGSSGHVFTDGQGECWPRSNAEDVARAVDELEGAREGPTRVDSSEVARQVSVALRGDAALREGLRADLGPVAEHDRFAPEADAIERAAVRLARGRPEHDVPEGEIVALGLHWSESFASAAGRALRAVARGSRLLLLSDPHCPRFALAVADAIEAAGFGRERIAVLHDDGLDVLRAVTARPGVALDAVNPSAFVDGARARLIGLRDEAKRGAEAGAGSGEAWFGHGVVERPPAAIHLRMPSGRDVAVGDVELPPSVDPIRLAAIAPSEAAEEVVERAFGRGALGGFADDAVARVHVHRGVFSLFTECLLRVLEDADGDPWFDPPRWALSEGERRTPDVVARGRRIGLDEGATLIHERRALDAEGDRSRHPGAGVHGLVFTNVEARMRLGGSHRVPGTLSLIRCVEGSKD